MDTTRRIIEEREILNIKKDKEESKFYRDCCIFYDSFNFDPLIKSLAKGRWYSIYTFWYRDFNFPVLQLSIRSYLCVKSLFVREIPNNTKYLDCKRKCEILMSVFEERIKDPSIRFTIDDEYLRCTLKCNMIEIGYKDLSFELPLDK